MEKKLGEKLGFRVDPDEQTTFIGKTLERAALRTELALWNECLRLMALQEDKDR